MIRHQESKYAWEFMYIGANQDSFAVSQSMGMKYANTMNYMSNNVGTRSAFASMSKSASLYRTSGKVEIEEEK